MPYITKKAAKATGRILDAAADEVSRLASVGLLDPVVAHKLALGLDQVSDSVERNATTTQKEILDDPSNVGEPSSSGGGEGPEKGFTQVEHSELSDKVEEGKLSPVACLEILKQASINCLQASDPEVHALAGLVLETRTKLAKHFESSTRTASQNRTVRVAFSELIPQVQQLTPKTASIVREMLTVVNQTY